MSSFVFNILNPNSYLSQNTCFLDVKLKIKQTSQHETKARAPPRHSLGRNLLRGREAVPHDVAEVQPTRRAHEDPEHVHLGEGQATGSLSSQPSWGRGSLPRSRGDHECEHGGNQRAPPPQPVRRFLRVLLSLTRDDL